VWTSANQPIPPIDQVKEKLKEIRLSELEEKVSGIVDRLERAADAAVQLESRVADLEDLK
ncbi:unnamed protein product, partial [marine sediment metagenome]